MQVSLLSLVGALGLTGIAAAQQLPDGGQLGQSLRLDRNLTLPSQSRALNPSPGVQLHAAPGGAVVRVRRFEVEGNTAVPTEALLASVAPFLDTPLDLAALQQATSRIEAAYKAAGRLARTYLPQQDVTEGVVKIMVVEARLGQVVAEASENLWVEPDRVLSMLGASQAPGEVLDIAALDRALLLSDDLAGVTVEGRLRAGQKDGETDLVLTLSRELRITGDIGLDNAGARATGDTRAYANVTLNSPLGQGDSLQLGVVHSVGSDYNNARYQFNVGPYGWRVGVSGSDFHYRLITPEFASLGGNGYSTTLGLDASYPLIRSPFVNLVGKLQYDLRRFHNMSVGTTQSRYVTESATASLSVNVYDTWGGGGMTSATAAITQGVLEQGTPDAAESSALAGAYTKLRYSLTRQQNLAPDWTLVASVSGQVARMGLDSSEKLYIGGANSLRAYPTSEASGTSGSLVSMELRWRLPYSLTASGFVEQAEVHNFGGASYLLSGTGLGLSWAPDPKVSFQLAISERVGRNPNPTTTGKDQDGSNPGTRVWANANVAF